MPNNYVNVPLAVTQNLGWQCPGCSRCYSPSVVQCYTCGEPIVTATEPTTGRCYVCGGHHPLNTSCPATSVK